MSIFNKKLDFNVINKYRIIKVLGSWSLRKEQILTTETQRKDKYKILSVPL